MKMNGLRMQQRQRQNHTMRLLFLVLGTVILLALFGRSLIRLYPLQAQTGLPTTHWLALPALRSGVGDPGLAVLDGKIHVVGGTEYFGSSGFHEVFDPVSQRWASLPDLPRQLSNAALAVVSDTLYVMGGYNVLEGGALPDTYRYAPATQSWLAASDMISPTSGAGVAVLDDEIYIFGGYDNYAESRLVQKYDPAKDCWTLGSPMSVGRSEFGMVTLNGLIYAIGGNIRVSTTQGEVSTRARPSTIARQTLDALSTLVSVYNPASDTWYNVAPLPAPRVSMAVAVLNGQIYVMGGTDVWISGAVQNSAYVYAPLSNQWSVAPALITARSGVRAVTVDDVIYVLGGYDQSNTPLANNEAYGIASKQLYLPVVQR